MKDKYIHALMDMTCRFGQTSTAEKLKVGCLIYKNDSIISLGVNGQPPKWHTEVCEHRQYVENAGGWLDEETLQGFYPLKDSKGRYKLVTKSTVRHAEAAALEKLYLSTETSDGATMFISHAPCLYCSLKIVAAKISTVYFKHHYRTNEGLLYLKQNGVKVFETIQNTDGFIVEEY